MSLLGGAISALTGAIDQFVGGQLVKAELRVDDDDNRSAEIKAINGGVLTFQFNPETIQVQRQAPTVGTPTHGTQDVQQQQMAAPSSDRESSLRLSNIVFDTYEQKPNKSVYTEYIELLEKFVGYDKDKHAPARLLFNWGAFTSDRTGRQRLKCYLDQLDVQYTMFLNDGKPVRAKVNMTLKLGVPHEEQDQMQSPDHAKLVMVRRGQSLADIAWAEYDNPAEWRRIADANGIDDPMSLRPGMQLIVPPILS